MGSVIVINDKKGVLFHMEGRQEEAREKTIKEAGALTSHIICDVNGREVHPYVPTLSNPTRHNTLYAGCGSWLNLQA